MLRPACIALVLGLAALGPAACTAPGGGTDAERYLGDRDFRRAALVAELVNPANGYSRLRLAHYATEDAGSWDGLPEWNPPVAPLGIDEPPRALALDASPDDPDALRALGEQAFFRYPVQLWSLVPTPRGLWDDPVHGSGGLVVVAITGQPTGATCATCHATPGAGALVPGLANATLDLGWGPGRVDVTTLAGTEPVKIPDLRPVRDVGYLQADATVRQLDLVSLAIRIETLIITSHQQTVRPPRLVSLALAEYLWSLAPGVAAPAPATAQAQHGATVFTATCAGCHAPPDFTGEPVPLAAVGTDPTVGLSADRGTGNYRVPSLLGVADRALLLHDASVHSLADLLDPARTTPGHRFGTDLSATDRADLVAYLSTLQGAP